MQEGTTPLPTSKASGLKKLLCFYSVIHVQINVIAILTQVFVYMIQQYNNIVYNLCFFLLILDAIQEWDKQSRCMQPHHGVDFKRDSLSTCLLLRTS